MRNNISVKSVVMLLVIYIGVERYNQRATPARNVLHENEGNAERITKP